jgi:hypothetical protein
LQKENISFLVEKENISGKMSNARPVELEKHRGLGPSNYAPVGIQPTSPCNLVDQTAHQKPGQNSHISSSLPFSSVGGGGGGGGGGGARARGAAAGYPRIWLRSTTVV